MSNVLARLQKFSGDKYPKFIVNILKLCSFDGHSLRNINENTIKDIEKFVQHNPIVLKNTVYQKDLEADDPVDFKFKIGHKYLLLGIPDELKKFNEHRNLKKKKAKQEKQKSVSTDIPENLKTELIKKLMTKIENYEKRLKVKLNVKSEQIKHLEKTETGYKCSVICPTCEKSFNCYNNSPESSYWIISNFTNHWRSHSLAQSTLSNNNIRSVTSNNLDLLDIIYI